MTCIIIISDNPLLCSCELLWFPKLLKSLKDRDDEMTQKKRPMCTMANENREYFVQNMPVERMNCINNVGSASLSSFSVRCQLNNNCIFLLLGGMTFIRFF